MKNTELAFCKFSKYPILKSIRVKFSRYKQKSMNVSVSFDTLILIYKNAPLEMRTAAYKVGVASDRRRRQNVPRHILCDIYKTT